MVPPGSRGGGGGHFRSRLPCPRLYKVVRHTKRGRPANAWKWSGGGGFLLGGTSWVPGGAQFRSRLPCLVYIRSCSTQRGVDLPTPGSGRGGGGGGFLLGGTSWVPGGGAHFRSRLPCLVYIRSCPTQRA